MSYQASHVVAEHSEARGNARLVAFVLGEAAHLEDASCYLSTETIAKRTKCHRNTVASALKSLAEAGEVRIWSRLVRGPNGAVNLYQLVLPGLPHEQRPPQAGIAAPDTGPGFAQDQGKPVSTESAGGSHKSAGGLHNQVVREESLRTVQEPSKPAARAREAEEPPFTEAEGRWARPLREVSIAKGARLSVGGSRQAVADFSDRDVVHEAEQFRWWHLEGRGQNKPLMSVTAAWRNWLRGAAPATVRPMNGTPRPPRARGTSWSAEDMWRLGQELSEDDAKKGSERCP